MFLFKMLQVLQSWEKETLSSLDRFFRRRFRMRLVSLAFGDVLLYATFLPASHSDRAYKGLPCVSLKKLVTSKLFSTEEKAQFEGQDFLLFDVEVAPMDDTDRSETISFPKIKVRTN
jgi:hypothetical protein